MRGRAEVTMLIPGRMSGGEGGMEDVTGEGDMEKGEREAGAA